MNKKELLNKLNEIIDEQYCSVVREIFEEMIDTNNINRDIDTYINIETGEIFTEVYRFDVILADCVRKIERESFDNEIFWYEYDLAIKTLREFGIEIKEEDE